MKTPGQHESAAIAISKTLGMAVFWSKRGDTYEIFRKLPSGGVTLVKRTKSPAALESFFKKQGTAKPRQNPAFRDAPGAARLADGFGHHLARHVADRGRTRGIGFHALFDFQIGRAHV